MTHNHPEPAEIAAFGADLLPPEEAAPLRDHLAACASCAEIEADLAVLSQELGDVPSPPIPADVADRIDAALAAEATRSTSFHVKQRRWPQLSLAAAAALVAVGLGAAALQGVGADMDGDAAGGEAMEHDQNAALGDRDPMEGQVRRLLSESDSADTFGIEETKSSSPEADSPTLSLPLCVRSAIDRTETPLAAGEETYRGDDAYLVVLPGAGHPEQVDAYMIDSDCVTAEPSGRGEILAQESYPVE